MEESSPHIGGLNEKSLHRQLKLLYSTPGSLVEEKVSGYVVDVAAPEGIVEIQTGGFSGMRRKLTALLEEHPVRLVHPVAVETTISLYDEDGGKLKSSRRSPKRGCPALAAAELLYLAELLSHPNLTVEILMVKQEEIRRDDGRGSWRRKGVSIEDRRLIEVTERHLFESPRDYLGLLPEGLPSPFGNREVAEELKGLPARGRMRLAGQMTYLLKKLEILEPAGKEGRRNLFRVAAAAGSLQDSDPPQLP